MKKLLVMVIGAAAAFGASAIETGVGFESFTIGDTPTTNELNATTGDYWRDPVSATNTYTVEAMDASYYATGDRPAAFTNQALSANALNVKTTFGNPLKFNVNAGGGSQALDGVYFDSLVKFTVCEEAPEEDYSGAKIVMWLQEEYDPNDDSIVKGTNLMVKAGFLSVENQSLKVVATNYTCDASLIDADSWHRVTIKAIGDITSGSTIPGFAIYVDEILINTLESKWDASFTSAYTLKEVARILDNRDHGLFPSLIQSGDKSILTSVGFDGTGSINELLFTKTAPAFADDDQYLADKFSLQIAGAEDPLPFKTFGAAVDYINNELAGTQQSPIVCTLSLVEGVAFDGPVAFDNSNYVDITLDLNGLAVTNDTENYAIVVKNGTYMTITDSSEAKTGAIVSDSAIFIEIDGDLTLTGGTIDGQIDIEEETIEEETYTGYCHLMGGAVKQDNIDPADGFALVARGETGFYDIVPAFTVTFKDGDVVLTNILNVATNTPADEIEGIPTPAKIGYTFAGWLPAVNTTVIVSNTTFTAQWDADTVTVTFNKNAEAATGTMSDQTFTHGVADNLTANAFVYEGHTFEGWADDPNGDVLYVDAASATFTANTTLYAKWRTNSYTVRFLDGESVLKSETVNYGEKATAPAAPSETGYTFTGWSPDTNNVITAATDFVAQWSLDSYTITFEPGTGATVTPATTNFTIESGEITLPEPTGLTGVTFDGWTNATITAATKTFTPAAGNLENFTLYAKWTSLVPTPTVVTTDTVEGDTAADATAAADAAIVRTAAVEATGVSAETYATYFTKSTPVYNELTGKYDVKISIAETVQTGVETEAVTALTTSATTVAVPAGLYYKISASDSLPIVDANPLTELSDGNPIDVSTKKASSGTARFFKIELGASSFK